MELGWPGPGPGSGVCHEKELREVCSRTWSRDAVGEEPGGGGLSCPFPALWVTPRHPADLTPGLCTSLLQVLLESLFLQGRLKLHKESVDMENCSPHPKEMYKFCSRCFIF